MLSNMQKYYKVVAVGARISNTGRHLRQYESVCEPVDISHGGVVYKINRWARPKKGFKRLFVFKSKEKAMRFAHDMGPDIAVFECKIKDFYRDISSQFVMAKKVKLVKKLWEDLEYDNHI